MIFAGATMVRMKRILAWVLVSGCSAAEVPPSPPPPAMLPEGRTRAEGVVFTGAPGGASVAACDRFGRWRADGAVVEHWIEVPDEKKTVRPHEGGARLSLFRSTLPFPQVTWGGSGLEVTQLLYPAGSGFGVRYHVMNHGDEAKTCHLTVSGGSLVAADAPASQSGGRFTYVLKIEPGASSFVHLTSPGLGGRPGNELLDQAIAAWEPKTAGRKLHVPDEAAVTSYFADLAGAALGIAGCAEAVQRFHDRIARREGEALRLFPDVPDEWLFQEIEAEGIPTPFGPLTFRYTGAYNNRLLELADTCRPPGGFLLAVPKGLAAKVDHQAATPKDGLLRVPGGARRVEMGRAP
jgi:hypothetical protein